MRVRSQVRDGVRRSRQGAQRVGVETHGGHHHAATLVRVVDLDLVEEVVAGQRVRREGGLVVDLVGQVDQKAQRHSGPDDPVQVEVLVLVGDLLLAGEVLQRHGDRGEHRQGRDAALEHGLAGLEDGLVAREQHDEGRDDRLVVGRLLLVRHLGAELLVGTGLHEALERLGAGLGVVSELLDGLQQEERAGALVDDAEVEQPERADLLVGQAVAVGLGLRGLGHVRLSPHTENSDGSKAATISSPDWMNR